MRRVKHLVPLVLAAALLAGCTQPPPTASTGTGTATTSATAQPVGTSTPPATAPTPIRTAPVRAWDAPPMTGVGPVDAFITAVLARDSIALTPYMKGAAQPCRKDRQPSCGEGTLAGALVPAILFGSCPGQYLWTALEGDPGRLARMMLDGAGMPAPAWHLRAVSRTSTGSIIDFLDAPVSTSGMRVLMTDDGVGSVSLFWLVSGCTQYADPPGSVVVAPPPPQSP